MKKLSFIICFLLSFSIFGQQDNVNNYKYIIVPKKFEFLKEENQYRVNTLVKFLFEKYNFNAAYGDDLPVDLNANPCLGLKTEVIDDSNMFTTKLKVRLSDCRGKVVYTSEEGKSKIKDFEGAYQEALRDAFKSIDRLNYKYKPSTGNEMPIKTTSPVTTPVNPTREVVQQSMEEEVVSTEVAQEYIPAEVVATEDMLYAQPIANGFQLVDLSPKVVYIIKKTTTPNYYVLLDKNGVVYNKNGKWVAEYYEGDTLKQEALNIKF